MSHENDSIKLSCLVKISLYIRHLSLRIVAKKEFKENKVSEKWKISDRLLYQFKRSSENSRTILSKQKGNEHQPQSIKSIDFSPIFNKENKNCSKTAIY